MLIYGLKVTLLGMGIVFIALYLLILLIRKLKVFSNKPYGKEKIPKKVVPVVEQTKPIQIVKGEEEDEIAAVVAAAILACGNQIRVKTIKRITGEHSSEWAQSGRIEAMHLRKL
ncbi:MAG: OadG family transporter subunit [Peptococcales bacterium]|jgi:sodium pump decarboxylase gamma subunit